MTPNPFSAQVYIVVALMALHNFIHQEAIIDNLFIEYDIKGAIRDDQSIMMMVMLLSRRRMQNWNGIGRILMGSIHCISVVALIESQNMLCR